MTACNKNKDYPMGLCSEGESKLPGSGSLPPALKTQQNEEQFCIIVHNFQSTKSNCRFGNAIPQTRVYASCLSTPSSATDTPSVRKFLPATPSILIGTKIRKNVASTETVQKVYVSRDGVLRLTSRPCHLSTLTLAHVSRQFL